MQNTANTSDSILLDIIIEDAPENLSGRHSACPPTGCWGHRNKPSPNGYRKARVGGRNDRLHRLVYECLRGPIPKWLQLDHLCRNRGCCNPDHLEPVTGRVNNLRGECFTAANAAKTHCPKGHPYAGANLYVNPKGGRVCRECVRERMRIYREKRRVAVRTKTWYRGNDQGARGRPLGGTDGRSDGRREGSRFLCD